MVKMHWEGKCMCFSGVRALSATQGKQAILIQQNSWNRKTLQCTPKYLCA